MRDDIWYREELTLLLALVTERIARANPLDVEAMTTLGHLHLKLETAASTAPSGRTPDPAPTGSTMAVGVGDAKEMPPGLAEELAGMSAEDRAVAQRVADLGEIEPAPGYEERAVDRARREGVLIDLSRAPVSAAAIAAHPRNGNCPTCELGGVTPERARLEAPRWYAALLTVPDMAVPDAPAACCWDCRKMIAAGLDPAAIIAPDHAEYVAQRAVSR